MALALASPRISITFDIDLSYNKIDLSYNNTIYTLSGVSSTDEVEIKKFFIAILPDSIKSSYASLSNRNTLNNYYRFWSQKFDYIKTALQNADPGLINAFNKKSSEKLLNWAIKNKNKLDTVINDNIITTYNPNSTLADTTVLTIILNNTSHARSIGTERNNITKDITKNIKTDSDAFMPTLFRQEFLDRFKSSLDTWFGQIQKDQNIDPTNLMVKLWSGGEGNNKTAKIYK